MGIEVRKEWCCFAVAMATGLNQICRIYTGIWISLRKYRVCRMTICAAGNLFRKPEAVVLAVVTFHVRLDRNIEHLVFGHQLLIAVALQAGAGPAAGAPGGLA